MKMELYLIINDGIIAIEKLVNDICKQFFVEGNMGKKKREHVVFDQMLKLKQSIPFTKVNTKTHQSKEKKK